MVISETYQRVLIDVSDLPRQIPFGSACYVERTPAEQLGPGDFVVTKNGNLKRLRKVLTREAGVLLLSGDDKLSGEVQKVMRAEYRGSSLNLQTPKPRLKWW